MIHSPSRVVMFLLKRTVVSVMLAVIGMSCSTLTGDSETDSTDPESSKQIAQDPGATHTEPSGKQPSENAEVTEVTASGSPGAYSFSVIVSSPDTGCKQYTDWWEVISQSGGLLYRRTLLHSHVDEQPFTRSGGPVEIQADDVVIVRAHMNSSGYGNDAIKGTVDKGFAPLTLPVDFAADMELLTPQPPSCGF
jgi:hypothetical protein